MYVLTSRDSDKNTKYNDKFIVALSCVHEKREGSEVRVGTYSARGVPILAS